MITELLPLIGGGLFGSITKLISMSMESKREERAGVIEALKAQAGVYNSTNQRAEQSSGFAFTRRVIALVVTFLVVYLSINASGEGVYVMETIRDGGNYLFGLIDTSSTRNVWTKLDGAVSMPVVTSSFQVIVGAYFGASIASSR